MKKPFGISSQTIFVKSFSKEVAESGHYADEGNLKFHPKKTVSEEMEVFHTFSPFFRFPRSVLVGAWVIVNEETEKKPHTEKQKKPFLGLLISSAWLIKQQEEEKATNVCCYDVWVAGQLIYRVRQNPKVFE